MAEVVGERLPCEALWGSMNVTKNKTYFDQFLTFIEPRGTHMVNVYQPPPPFQADRPTVCQSLGRVKGHCAPGVHVSSIV